MLREATVGLLRLVARQDVPEAGANTVTVDCDSGNDYDGRMGVRISAIFVILVGSFLGTWFPVFAKRHRGVGVPEWAFFIAKYFGSGVIIATAFIHVSIAIVRLSLPLTFSSFLLLVSRRCRAPASLAPSPTTPGQRALYS